MPAAPRAGIFWTLLGALALVLIAACLILGRAPSFPQALGLAALGGVMALLVSQSIRAPIDELTDVAQRIAHGELTARAPASMRDDMRLLGQTMNVTASQLQARVGELEAERNQARAILESMGEGVLALDRELRVLWLNTAAQRLLGVDGPPAPGAGLLELFRQPELEEIARSVLAGGAPASRELQAFSGAARVIRCQVVPCEGGERGASLVVVAQDVTEMRRLENLRREFVANVSHELKTPLTSIKGLVETLLSGALDDAANRRRFVTLVDQDATRLGQLIDDLLQLSQIESKAVVLKREAVDLGALFGVLLPVVEGQARERAVRVELRIAGGTPRVSGDPERLRQVFLNLLDNAIKYNRPGGSVAITAEPRGEQMAVRIADTGIGIPEADLPRIFERFYRVDKARSRALGGTGLGLSIVKHLVELHGGSVDVTSRLGEGTAFTVSLPRARA